MVKIAFLIDAPVYDEQMDRLTMISIAH